FAKAAATMRRPALRGAGFRPRTDSGGSTVLLSRRRYFDCGGGCCGMGGISSSTTGQCAANADTTGAFSKARRGGGGVDADAAVVGSAAGTAMGTGRAGKFAGCAAA